MNQEKIIKELEELYNLTGWKPYLIAIEKAINILEKQIPKEPTLKHYTVINEDGDRSEKEHLVCPVCNNVVMKILKRNFEHKIKSSK